MTEKTYFGCMDFRNAKFQGSISDNSLDGIGIVLDSEFMLCLSNWKNQIPYGPSLVIFPNRDYLYGHFKNKQLTGVCCYVTSTGEVYFFNFINGGSSETIVYIDNNSTIIEIDSREQPQKIKSYIKDKQTDNKWRLISNILNSEVTADYQDYKAFIKAYLLRDLNDIIQCSENANLTFIGFKDSVSLGAKFDRNNQVRQIGNFQEFPRNIEYGRKYTYSPNRQVKVQEGKFTAPEDVYVYRADKRNSESLKQTQHYFKMGTNFRNQFLKLNIFLQLSKHFSQVKSQSRSLKSFEFGQRILQSQPPEYGGERHSKDPTQKLTVLQQAKRDIYNAANKKAKVTSRSPLKNQIDPFNNEYEYRRSSRKNSNEKYQYLRQNNEIQISRPTKRSKDKYNYINQFKDTQAINIIPFKQTQYVLRYRDLTPEVSDFDRNIGMHYRNNIAADANTEALLQQRLINLRIDQLRREQDLLRNHEEAKHLSPISGLYPPQVNRNRSVSPLKKTDKYNEFQERHQKSQQQTQSKYQNYLDYKNRNKPEAKKQHENSSPNKINIYDRNVLGPSNLTPQKDIALLDKPRNIPAPQQMTLNPNKYIEKMPGRYKKTFKYLQ